jgi:hypothetical protein
MNVWTSPASASAWSVPATAVQLITEIAKEVGHLTVFQRTEISSPA